MLRLPRFLVTLFAAAACAAVQAAGTVGTTFPADFPVIEDTSLGKPVIGFGAAGPVTHVPVIFLHGNNDTPFPTFLPGNNNTPCSRFGRVQAFAQYLADRGYSTSELWALGYQGDQCDLPADQTFRSRIGHTVAANVPDLSRFVAAVLSYTGARQVDIVAHSLGVPLAREWMRQEDAYRSVRRFVAIDGPNHGIINCSPDPANYFQAPVFGGFTPQSEVCREFGSPHTPFLERLNRGDGTPPPTRVLVIRNADKSFVYFPIQDGLIAPVPAEDSSGRPTDFSQSARLQGAEELNLTGQGAFDPILGTSHLGILNSPQTWAATFDFLNPRRPRW
jgi:pimeloyl-ACP methyl ester carboxylesterase